eukprot:g25721.t2
MGDADAHPTVDFGSVILGESAERDWAQSKRELGRGNDVAAPAPAEAEEGGDADAAEDAAEDGDVAGAAVDGDAGDAGDDDGTGAAVDGEEGAAGEDEVEVEAAEEENAGDTTLPEASAEPVEAEPVFGDISEMMTWKERGSCKAFGSHRISCSFKPTRLGDFRAEMCLRFFNGALGDANYEKEYRVLARGSCIDVSIFVDSEEYDMGTCIFGQLVRQTVMVRNRSSVAMKIQVQKPKQTEGELQLNTALAYVQGSGWQPIQVKFSPKEDFLERSLGEKDAKPRMRHPWYSDPERGPGAFKIPMKLVGKDQVLPVKTCLTGVLIEDPAANQVEEVIPPDPISRILSFEKQLILPSVPKDSLIRESVIVTNISKVPQMINVVMPEYSLCHLKSTPVCCSLAPKESKRLQLEFKPTEERARALLGASEFLEYVNLLKPPPEEKPEDDAAPAEGTEEAAEEVMDEEEYKQHQLTDIRMHGGCRWESEEGNIHSSWQYCFLEVSTCVHPSVLALSPPKLDFGDITAGQRHVLPLIRLEALPENQCFSVLNAPRTVSERPFKFMIEFKPQMVQIYQSSLNLRTDTTRVQVPLRGKGVCPVLKIEPEDGIIHMGSVIYTKDAKDYTTNQLVIKNESPFELVYKLETVIRGDRGAPPFTLSPETATANSSLNVTVTFRPRRPNSLFREKVLVNVPNQREPTYVYLYGHCFKYQAYCLHSMDFTSFGRQEAAFLDSLAVGTGATVTASGGFEYPSAQPKDGINRKFTCAQICGPPVVICFLAGSSIAQILFAQLQPVLAFLGERIHILELLGLLGWGLWIVHIGLPMLGWSFVVISVLPGWPFAVYDLVQMGWKEGRRRVMMAMIGLHHLQEYHGSAASPEMELFSSILAKVPQMGVISMASAEGRDVLMSGWKENGFFRFVTLFYAFLSGLSIAVASYACVDAVEQPSHEALGIEEALASQIDGWISRLVSYLIHAIDTLTVVTVVGAVGAHSDREASWTEVDEVEKWTA